MNKEKSLINWKIRREKTAIVVAKWVRRKEFVKLTKDKNCFGKIIEGIHPERMTSEEYDEWVETLPITNMRL